MRARQTSDSRAQVAIVHPGVQHSAQLAEQLARVDVLSEIWTGVGVSDRGCLGPWVQHGATNPLARFLGRRIIRNVPASRIKLRPWHEVVAGCRQRLGHDEQGLMHCRNAAFQRSLPESIFEQNDVVVGFDTIGWILAQRCAAAGTSFVLDQSIAHPLARMRIYEQLRRQHPDWAEDMEERNPAVLAAEAAEQQGATRIVTASTFTQRSLIDQGIAPERIVINPYGVDLAAFALKPESHPVRPLRFVFVGQVGARKGIPMLLKAWGALDTSGAELWIVGHVAPRIRTLVSGHRNVVIKGPTSHLRMGALLAECDVFVFPSYFEGFGLVLLEAMACGLPVIATDATAAPDLIVDGVEGFVIRAGDEGALQNRMQMFLLTPSRVLPMGRAARKTAERFTWAAYGDRWATLVHELAQSRRTAGDCRQ
jgi:starch synthase